jgi:hypothetical protein
LDGLLTIFKRFSVSENENERDLSQSLFRKVLVNNGESFTPFFWGIIFEEYIKKILDNLFEKSEILYFKKNFLFWFDFSEEITKQFYKCNESLAIYYLEILSEYIKKGSGVITSVSILNKISFSLQQKLV